MRLMRRSPIKKMTKGIPSFTMTFYYEIMISILKYWSQQILFLKSIIFKVLKILLPDQKEQLFLLQAHGQSDLRNQDAISTIHMTQDQPESSW